MIQYGTEIDGRLQAMAITTKQPTLASRVESVCFEFCRFGAVAVLYSNSLSSSDRGDWLFEKGGDRELGERPFQALLKTLLRPSGRPAFTFQRIGDQAIVDRVK
jgi:hypothetical protein